MMGLLTSPWADPRSEGNGLLALAQAISPRNRFVGGLLDYGQQVAKAEDRDLKRRGVMLDLEDAERRMADAQAKREFLANIPGPEMQASMQALAGGGGPTVANAARIAPVSPQQKLMADGVRAGAVPFGDYLNSMQPKAPIKLGAGDSLFDPQTLSRIATNPKEQEAPSAVREYQFAKEQGFPGTFFDFETQKRKAGATSVSVNTGQKGLDNELKIRSDFRSEPIYKAHNEVQSAYQQITTALKQQSPAGDLAGATKIMKILDPGSVVRESELGMAMAATGALDRLTNYADMVVKGTKLSPSQRADFQKLADNLYVESAKQYNSKRAEYDTFAKDYQLNSDRILGPAITSPKLPAAGGVVNELPKNAARGARARDTATGQILTFDGFTWKPEKK